jgi:hypothetical protein
MKTTKQLLLTIAILVEVAVQIKAISTPPSVISGGPQGNQPINVAGNPPYNPQQSPNYVTSGPTYNPAEPRLQPGQPVNIPGGPSYNPQQQPASLAGGPGYNPQQQQQTMSIPGGPVQQPSAAVITGGPVITPQQVNKPPVKAPNFSQPAVKPAPNPKPGSGINK